MRRVVLPVIAVAALAVRLVPLLAASGLVSVDHYDDGVYYAAAASLVDGRLPYRDFVLLHPPLIALVLTPFAALGRLTSDPTGFLLARLAWILVGTATAVLAARFAARWGTGAALVAGLWVACSATASYASQSTFIEPAADLALLGGVVLISGDHERPRRELAAGVLLGVALTGKIWYVAPVGVLLLVLLLQRRFRPALRAAATASVTATAILLPFFVADPAAMWRMVVHDQLTRRPTERATLADRLALGTIGHDLGLGHPGMVAAATVATVLLVAATVAIARYERQAWPVAAVAAATLGLLLLSPSSFRHYGSLTAAPVGITLAVGLSLLGPRMLPHGRTRRVATVALVATIAATGVLTIATSHLRPFPRAQVAAVLPAGCITADSPSSLILTDRLTSDLRDRCPVPVDVSGTSYGVGIARSRDVPYLTWLRGYLTSGSAMILTRRPHGDGLSRPELAALGRPVYDSGRVRVQLPLRRGP
ncbi:glycosyltransferase 87 family protein [Nocardioides nematodiphilus]|uniref:glycosyltransferase 87 family protein n=1 Tax=Nocardioides nematodiphilus TaxID=2849669 RepID=UPI001CD9CA89|nr:glycosyltransferase 87 family protein [Nocardioides nematodiphilus]MCA1981784.1 glycosyltransferase 87 family protein [Nocardioides nematodiphilus]